VWLKVEFSVVSLIRNLNSKSVCRRSRLGLCVTILSLLCGCSNVNTTRSHDVWTARHQSAHPLVGKIFSTRRARLVSHQEFLDALQLTRYILLGEKHDHPDHHRLQAQIVAAQKGVRAVVLEMVRVSYNQRIAGAQTPDEFRQLSEWDKSGWPDFEIYRPLINRVFELGLKPLGGLPPKSKMIAAIQKRTPNPLDDESMQRMRSIIREAHCGYADESLVRFMTNVQMLKDRSLAHELRSHAGFGRGILIAGNGHVRRDFGVPNYLKETISVGFIEVESQKNTPESYDLSMYDFVYFTPVFDLEDACAKFKHRLEKLPKHPSQSKSKSKVMNN